MTTFSVQSFGCRVNQAEAFSWVEELQDKGLVYVNDCMKSDIVLINSCTLTSRADRDVRGFIRKVGRENPESRMILTGCYVNRILGLQNQGQVVKLVPNADKDRLVQSVLSLSGSEEARSHVPYKSRALIKIQDGCDYHCTFCIIPSVRGPSRSVAPQDIIAQVRDIIQKGFSEIVLTGVHLCLYGLDLEPKLSLLQLLDKITRLKGLGRIRLSSLDPRFLNGGLLDFLVSNTKICPHFHLSLQHGSDAVLQKMGRNIRTERYVDIIRTLRRGVPDAAIGADIIVGFPGEKDRDFENTYSLLEETPLTYFHVFSYSPRPGTPAAGWKGVTERIAKDRAGRLRRLSRRKNLAFRRTFIGSELEAAVIEKQNGAARILTGNYIDVKIPSCPAEIKSLVRVIITEASPTGTSGEIAAPNQFAGVSIGHP